MIENSGNSEIFSVFPLNCQANIGKITIMSVTIILKATVLLRISFTKIIRFHQNKSEIFTVTKNECHWECVCIWNFESVKARGQTKQNRGSWTHTQQIQVNPMSTPCCPKIQIVIIIIMNATKNVVLLNTDFTSKAPGIMWIVQFFIIIIIFF